MFKRLSFALSLALLTACGGDEADDGTVTLDWQSGETFYVAASYRVATVHTEEVPVSLDGELQPTWDEHWTPEAYWTYQVTESGFVPDETDDLYEYAVTNDGVASLAVVRAFIDPSLNDDPELMESDPVVYLVFREDRDRLAAVIQFVNQDGTRIEQAWSSKELGKSWQALSQSMLTAAPTYLAPFSAKYEEADTFLENGSVLSTVDIDDGVVDAYYDDELGGGLVMSRYEVGQPWPTVTMTDNLSARLLTDDDVAARRAQLPFLLPEDAPDFDYKAALRAAIDIDAAISLDEETMAGGWDVSVAQEYKPWAGSWWKQSEGALVFGYRSGKDTISDEFYAELMPMKSELDVLSETIRDMADGADKDAKREEYKTKQKTFVDALVADYNGVLQDLVGGTIVVENGQVKHNTNGWAYDIETLSPMDKFALHLYLEGQTSPNPFYGPAWELLNHWSPSGGSWWGHCNGWSGAAILEFEPREAVDVTVKSHAFTYSTADQKGLTSELHYSTYSQFYGARYNGEDDDISDLTPKAFHQIISFYIREQGVPLVFDTTADAPVWNYPAYAVDLDVTETTEGGAARTNINTADVAALDALPGIGETLALRIITYRQDNGPFQTVEEIQEVRGIGSSTFNNLSSSITVDPVQRTFSVVAAVKFTTDGVDETHVDTANADPNGFTNTYRYTLTTDEHGKVLEGTWEDVRKHPDFAWIPYSNPTGYSNGGSENPYVVYGEYIERVVDLRK